MMVGSENKKDIILSKSALPKTEQQQQNFKQCAIAVTLNLLFY